MRTATIRPQPREMATTANSEGLDIVIHCIRATLGSAQVLHQYQCPRVHQIAINCLTGIHPVADFVLSVPQARCTALYSARKRPSRVSLFRLTGGSTRYNLGVALKPQRIETIMIF